MTEDEDAFRQFSRKPKKRGGRRHPGKGDRKKRSRKKVRRPGFSSRKGRNKKAHAEHGNQLNLVYWGTMLALIPLGYKGVVQIDNVVEDVMGSVSVNTVLLVDKMGSQGVALVETMGLFLRATLMSMFVVFMTWCGWTVSRKCRNKAMHRLHGNMLGEGQRTKKFMTRTGHVFVTEELVLGRNVMKCTCKAFIDLGTECQHIIVPRQRWADQPLTGGVASTIGEDRAGSAGETLQAVPILDEVTSPGFSLRSRSAPSRSEYVEVGCLQGLVSKAKELGTGSRNKQPRVASAERDDACGQSSGLVRDDFSSPLATSEGAVLYLQQVLNDIRKESNPPGSLRSDHLSRLNAAVFNLSGRGAVDSALALKVFQTVDKIHTAYNAEKYDNSDSAFFSNYLALLGTMQNQVFFSQKQNEKFVSWIKLAVDGSGKLVHLLDKALETENEKLRLQLSRLERSGEPSRSSTEPRSRAG